MIRIFLVVFITIAVVQNSFGQFSVTGLDTNNLRLYENEAGKMYVLPVVESSQRGDTMLYRYADHLPEGESPDFTLRFEASPIGRYLMVLSNGDWIFSSDKAPSADIMMLRTKAAIGDRWKVGSSGMTVELVDRQFVKDDSILVFETSGKHTIKLSKNLGLVEFPNFVTMEGSSFLSQESILNYKRLTERKVGSVIEWETGRNESSFSDYYIDSVVQEVSPGRFRISRQHIYDTYKETGPGVNDRVRVTILEKSETYYMANRSEKPVVDDWPWALRRTGMHRYRNYQGRDTIAVKWSAHRYYRWSKYKIPQVLQNSDDSYVGNHSDGYRNTMVLEFGTSSYNQRFIMGIGSFERSSHEAEEGTYTALRAYRYDSIQIGNPLILDIPERRSQIREMSIYPNPISAGAKLHLAQLSEKEVKLQLFNMQGQLFWEYDVAAGETGATIPIDLASGMYYLKSIGTHAQWGTTIVVKP